MLSDTDSSNICSSNFSIGTIWSIKASKVVTIEDGTLVNGLGDKVEKILLPSLGEVKVRKDHFYSFWICDFLNPREELFWYGMNVDGLEIPKDYNKSVAGMWIEVWDAEGTDAIISYSSVFLSKITL